MRGEDRRLKLFVKTDDSSKADILFFILINKMSFFLIAKALLSYTMGMY